MLYKELALGWVRWKHAVKLEATAIIQMREVSGLDQGGGSKGGEKWLDIKEISEDTVGCTFKVVRKGSHSIIIILT